MTGDLDDLIDEILVDAYGESEQLTAFEQAFAESARFPFPASIVGVSVDVVRIEFDGDERHGLTAHCRREGEKHRISLADLVPGPVTLETSRLLAAYRKWQGLPEFRPASPAHAVEPWIYRPVAKNLHPVAQPLALQPMGSWDPAEQYWGEEGEEVHPLYRAIIAAGPRPEFEMEQVIPGVDEDDWDSDPVTNAAELNRAGFDREARRILEGLIVLDERCIDAWVHLGNIAFDAKGPKAALELYDTAVAIGEQSAAGSIQRRVASRTCRQQAIPPCPSRAGLVRLAPKTMGRRGDNLHESALDRRRSNLGCAGMPLGDQTATTLAPPLIHHHKLRPRHGR